MSFIETIFKFTPLGRYFATPLSLEDGEYSELAVDSSGRLMVSTQSSDRQRQHTGAPGAERVVANAPSSLYEVTALNTGGSDVYLFLFDHADDGDDRPANGGLPLLVPILVKAGEHASWRDDDPIVCTTGIYWAASSTAASFTYASTADLMVAAKYT